MDVRNMDQATRDGIAAMAVPQDMDPAERKRQYAALGRAIRRDAPPEVVAKFSMATDPERRLDISAVVSFLFCFLCNPLLARLRGSGC